MEREIWIGIMISLMVGAGIFVALQGLQVELVFRWLEKKGQWGWFGGYWDEEIRSRSFFARVNKRGAAFKILQRQMKDVEFKNPEPEIERWVRRYRLFNRWALGMLAAWVVLLITLVWLGME